MKHPTFQAFVSLWAMICMLFASTPLGCNSVQVRHPDAQFGQPFLPEDTEERFKECVALIDKEAPPGRYSVDARIKLAEDGRVMEATTTGEPHPDVGVCIRVALREMHVGSEVIEQAALRSPQPSSRTAETPLNRTYLGQVETVTFVTIVFVEVVIDEVLVAVGITVTASAVANTGAQIATRGGVTRGGRKPHQPIAKKWLDNGGSIDQKADGTTTYTRSDGVSVTYDKEGFPDFTPHRHPTVKDVQIEFTGSREKDNRAADQAAGITEKKRQDEEYTWHHHEDGKTMQLIKKDVHQDFFHTGGMARARKDYGKCE